MIKNYNNDDEKPKKTYYERNKAKIKEQRKIYYKQNKAKIDLYHYKYINSRKHIHEQYKSKDAIFWVTFK